MIKRILAILALISMAAFVVCTVIMLCTMQPGEGLAMMLIPLSCFLMFGLLSLGIRWLEKIKKERLEELKQEALKQAAQKKDGGAQ